MDGAAAARAQESRGLATVYGRVVALGRDDLASGQRRAARSRGGARLGSQLAGGEDLGRLAGRAARGGAVTPADVESHGARAGQGVRLARAIGRPRPSRRG
jgi:hypothetical protein